MPDSPPPKGAAPLIFGKTGIRQPAQVLEPMENRAWVGCHIDVLNGYYEACRMAHMINADCLALILGSMQQWNIALPTENEVNDLHRGMEEFGYTSDQFLPHASFLINLCSPDDDAYSRSTVRLRDELRICAKLGLKLLNVHPGSTLGQCPRSDAIKRAGEAINHVLTDSQTGDAVVVLEMMAGSKTGNVVGCQMSDIAGIIAAVSPELRGRVGVCVDTCHCFAAGFDLTSKAAVDLFFERFDKAIGLQYLKAFHLNDARERLGSHVDRHANIGVGCIGLGGFQALMRHPAVVGHPMCLETPGSYGRQIEILKRLERGERVLRNECVEDDEPGHHDL